jgi:hypothetical protein
MKRLPLLLLSLTLLVACRQSGVIGETERTEAMTKGQTFCELVSKRFESSFIVYDLKDNSCGLVLIDDKEKVIDSILERDLSGQIVWLMDGQKITVDDFLTDYNEVIMVQGGDIEKGLGNIGERK